MTPVTFLRYTIAFIFSCILIVPVQGQVVQPQSALEHFNIGLRHLNERRFSEALDAFRLSAKLKPNQPETHGNIGAALMGLNRPAEAADAFREAIRIAPRDGSFHTALCGALMAMRKPDEAIAACETGVKLNPDSPDAYGAYADTLSFAGHPRSEIQRAIDSALIRFPENERIVLAAAEHYSSTNLSHAAELFEKAIRINPSARNHARLADIYLKLEREVEAVAAARKALEIEPDNPFANFFMGKLFFELGLHEEAAAAFKKAAASSEDLADLQYYHAVSEARRGRRQAAIAILRTAIAGGLDDLKSNYELGRLLVSEAEYDEALISLRRAVSLAPGNAEVKAHLGLALTEAGQFTQAISVLEDVAGARPGNQFVGMMLGVARARQQQIPQIEDMKRFAKENPNDLNVRVGLVELLAYARRFDEAEPFIEEIWKLDPKDVQIFQHIAVAYSSAGFDDKALAVYRKALELGEKPDPYVGIAGILSKRGQAEEASRAYAKVIELKPDVPNIMKGYADHLRDNGKRREALEMYKRSLAILPMNGPALFNAGVLSAKFGEMDAARSYLESLRTADPTLAKALERCLRLMIWN